MSFWVLQNATKYCQSRFIDVPLPWLGDWQNNIAILLALEFQILHSLELFQHQTTKCTIFNKFKVCIRIFFNDNFRKLLLLTLISIRKHQRKFEDVHEKLEFQFLPEKCHL